MNAEEMNLEQTMKYRLRGKRTKICNAGRKYKILLPTIQSFRGTRKQIQMELNLLIKKDSHFVNIKAYLLQQMKKSQS